MLSPKRPVAARTALRIPALLALPVCAAPLGAATIDVPGDAPTIQAGIALAQPGDEVLVAPGTYAELIDFLGKAISVRSSGGPGVTIIDGEYTGTVVTFASGEGPASIIEGFTIRRGMVYDEVEWDTGGGGILVDGSSPVIRGNVIRDNAASWFGAGILCVDSNALIEGNLFEENSLIPTIGEVPAGMGGGVHVEGGSVILVGNRFFSNLAGEGGGAIGFSQTSGSTARDTVCIGNSADYGGAIAISYNSPVVIENLLALDNLAWGPGSIFGHAPGHGGAIHTISTLPVQIRGATIVGNTANAGDAGPGVGGGISGPCTVTNSIIRDNSAGDAPQITADVTVTWSDVQGGAPGVGNFDASALFFVGPSGDRYLRQIAAGQLSNSPCVDAGDPLSSPPPGTTTRTDHAPDTGIIDVGYHYPAVVPMFRRANCNGDAGTDIADAVHLLDILFPQYTYVPPRVIDCADACDANDDGDLDVADAVTILVALFSGGAIPPPTAACGVDPTPNSLGCLEPPGC